MKLPRGLVRGLAALAYRAARVVLPGVYAQDGLVSVHNHDFIRDEAFARAYARGTMALDGAPDYAWHWRVHVGLWAASTAARLDGDFVECGVNRGFLASAIMERLGWDALGRTFWLLDTFAGLDERLVSAREREQGVLARNREELRRGFYVEGPERAMANFAQWRNARIVVGPVPDTLPQVTAARIAYLHLDMNCAEPEVAALEHFWPRLAPGAVVLLDDYAYAGFGAQKQAMDDFALRRDVAICSLPTGQGLLLRPPH
ncbi:MAG TPA: TylF/MycF/NovP-related O-methyltransferase [Casimicrobiaceae bacterium]|nr:TylF/MycF/NovP-related O-methyltransferase [Casimicrobiaceae bacterium]